MTSKELLRLKFDLDLSPEAFADMTGLNFHRLRRGRIPEPIALAADRLAVTQRARKLHQMALAMSGDAEKALEWIYAPSPVFSDRCPIDLCASDDVFSQVEGYIERMRLVVGNVDAALPVAKEAPPAEPVITPAPAAIDDEDRFRIAERLKEARSKLPNLTKAEIARAMVKAGHDKFTGAKLWRYEIGYEPTWSEIKVLAEILGVDAHWLSGLSTLTK